MPTPSQAAREVVKQDALLRGIPAWTYAHDGLARLEYERVLLPSWQIAGHANAIPHPGDFFTLELGRDSVIVVRGRDGEVRAFQNVCRHRGARLLDGSGRCPGQIRCPYHGWAYDLTGALRGVPVTDSFPGLRKEDFGLRSVRSETLFGLVFVCLAGDPPPLAELWQPFAAELAPYRIAEMLPLGPTEHEDWAADWKVAMENYLESYHVPVGHPGLFRMFTADYVGQVNRPDGLARGVGRMRERPSAKWGEREYQKLAGRVADHLPADDRRAWRYYSMMPNIGIDAFPDQIDFFQVLPRGPGKCTIRMANFALPDERREMRLLRYLNHRINRQVQREDVFLTERVQRGLASTGWQPGPLSAHEACIAQFHARLRARIPEIDLPAAPATFA